MDQGGIDSRHIMKVSGLSSETSLKSYSHNKNASKKREISSVLSKSLICTIADISRKVLFLVEKMCILSLSKS
ncbi:hypothetical protein KUTeg_003201 [Tegillarca granosa]|uniref:Uncharacterized protein n=1 Tax=Tegillarca granosa TaxID=220873 RepID=A0ABQ9FLG3_TEGGR|nr:hypothetical protein KUTeg_003201 [Tegillarca granosa]